MTSRRVVLGYPLARYRGEPTTTHCRSGYIMGQANSRQRFFGLNLQTFNVVLLTAGLLIVLSLWTLGILGTIRVAADTMVVAVLWYPTQPLAA